MKTTTVFTMRYWEKISSIFIGGCAVFLLLLGIVTTSQAADISAHNPQLVLSDDGYNLNAEFTINFNPRLEEAVNKGIVLYFVTDFSLMRSRWYWLDEQVLSRSRTIQLSYNALSRQYRLSTGTLHQNFTSLDEALRVLARTRNWPVFEKGDIRPSESYIATVRMRLDLTQMPRTFQIGAIANKDWKLTSDWLNWTFSPSDGEAK